MTFFDERGAMRHWLEERIPGGARWAYVFGSALLFLLAAQLASGLALAFTYSASVPAAWASVAQLEATAFGRFVRSLHAHGATFLLATAAAHLLQTASSGAYRRPREVTWWLGLALLTLLLAFCLTGSLLPWDERGYWATRVTIGIAGSIGGKPLERLLVGGPELGNATLTRFFALHAMLLPLLTAALALAHVAAMRRQGITPLDTRKPEEPFWPRQALYDAVFALILLAALTVVALKLPAPLQGPADPGGAASPRPDWYFRPLFELLKLVPASLETAVTLVLPLLALAFLAGMPFLKKREPALAVLMTGLIAAASLAVASFREDAQSPQFQLAQARAAKRAQKALQLAKAQGVPPEGALALLQDQPEERGARLFARACVECHRARGTGGDKAPRLDGFLSKAWIRRVLEHPEAPELYGNAKISGMEGYGQLGADKLAQLTDYLYALRSKSPDDPALDSGRRVYQQAGCAECHSLQKGGSEGAPTLYGYGSGEWLRGLLRDAGGPGYYETQNRMPDFGNRLAPGQIDDLVAFVQSLEAEGDL